MKDSQQFELRLPSDFSLEAGRWYDTPDKVERDEHMAKVTKAYVKENGCLNAELFMQLARWKSPRLTGRAARNTEQEIEEMTRMALSAKTERCRIACLTGLEGVGWPMASVILHFCHRDRYPILDVRALGTLGVKTKPAYNLDFWVAYIGFCRDKAKQYKASMRSFDRALWGYSYHGALIRCVISWVFLNAVPAVCLVSIAPHSAMCRLPSLTPSACAANKSRYKF